MRSQIGVGMSLVSINDVLKITTRVEKIHPYKVVGDRDSYSPYNEGWSDCVSLIESYLEKLPSAEPERKKGEWEEKQVIDDPDNGIPEWQSAKCSVCGKYLTTPYLYYFDNYKFCPHCGADMRGE
jgi:hypothetical protein